jgi:riboflavin biosynthesis pyrimidine reductase
VVSPDLSAPLLTALMDDHGLPPCPLTPVLERLHGGRFGLRTPSLYANFVSSVDGVVAAGPEHLDAGSAISGHSEADRFLMALLRACADAILIGAGTLRTTPGHRWTPEQVFPAAAGEFTELRGRLRRAAHPRLVVVTASGDLDTGHPALSEALILTGDDGAERLDGRLPRGTVVRSLGRSPRLDARAIVSAVHAEGHRAVLTEGGPTLLGDLLGADLLDELFLTVSPVVAGRASASRRLGLVDGLAFHLADAPWLDLLSVHRHQGHLFLRYRVRRG